MISSLLFMGSICSVEDDLEGVDSASDGVGKPGLWDRRSRVGELMIAIVTV